MLRRRCIAQAPSRLLGHVVGSPGAPAPASDLVAPREGADAGVLHGVLTPAVVGREAERRRLDDLAAGLGAGARSLVLVGEAGIGKTTLWRYGTQRCREHGATVLVARPAEDDRQHPAQGLRDLLRPAGDEHDAPSWLDDGLPLLERSRAVLDHLRRLSQDGPVVLAVDDLPWLDPFTRAVVRFALDRLGDAPVLLLATARTWSPDTLVAPPGEVDRSTDVVGLEPLRTRHLRQIVRRSLPTVSRLVAARACELAHGNPFFAVELARADRGAAGTWSRASLLPALGERVSGLPEGTVELARLLALNGPSPLPVLAAAAGGDLDEVVRAGLDAQVLDLDEDFVLRFAHPLIATAVLEGTNAIERSRLRRALADVVPDRDTRTLHLARATAGADERVAADAEAAAHRMARRRSPRAAAELFGHSARLTARADEPAVVRRTLAQSLQHACTGDLAAALELLGALLGSLEPGPLRAEVVGRRVALDFVGAEDVLREAVGEVPPSGSASQERLRGRLLGLLGWLVGVHLGRPAEGLGHASVALGIGREHDDDVLVAQAASVVSTTSLLLGRPVDGLVDEAVSRGAGVVGVDVVLWPRALRGRQRLWDGHLAAAREDLTAMHAVAERGGTELQLAYRCCDLALLEVASGDLDAAASSSRLAVDGARDCGDARALSWAAYPWGQVAALRGDADTASWCADRLDGWADRAGERPRRAMAAHVRGLLAVSVQDWSGALDQLLAGVAVLDDVGYVHPGPVPVLPQAVQVAVLAGRADVARDLARRLHRLADGLRSPWVSAQAGVADGLVALADDDERAVDVLADGAAALERLGARLDAARAGSALVTAGLRTGRRRDVREVAERCAATFEGRGVRGWDEVSRRHLERLRGGSQGDLTPTEQEVATLVAAGHRNREIGTRLFVSESTVEAHLTRIYRKLGVRNRAELVRQVASPALAT